MKYLTLKVIIWLEIILLVGCQKENIQAPAPKDEFYSLNLPPHFPQPEIPEDNLLTKNRVELGRLLFSDPILSRDSTVSCASCHKSELAFADNRSISPGVQGRLGKRNAPSLLYRAYATSLNWDGGVPTLELQALVPIQDHAELDMDFGTLVERLKRHPRYPALFQAAYQTEPNEAGIVKALAAFQRTLIKGTSDYDRYLLGDSSALSPSAKRGKDLFFSETAECFHCHSGLFFTDETFQNNGLYAEYKDQGRFLITGRERDKGKFRVPSLRNVALTAPYMHDGSIPTLEAVIEHYMKGGAKHPAKSPLIRPFTLTPQQKEDLINFLKSLTDK
ncbi:MAG: cytochrome c peroxidase [Bacteroidia bacterium]|nr:c-type cytochrome [Bacteroidia bacterium]MDW8159650.1 cytochrome c peroxidase [Bacteroidia bacterium]